MQSSLRKIFAISQDTFKMALNQRLLYGILILAILFILMTNLPFRSEEFRVFKDKPADYSAVHIAFLFINLFLLIISIFVSLSLLQNGLAQDQTILLLTKPVKRWELWLGNIFGLFWILSLVWLVMVLETWIILVIYTHKINMIMFPALAIILLLSFVYASIVSFFYAFIPNILSGIIAALIIFSGLGSSEVLRITEGLFSPYFRSIMKLTIFFLPQIVRLWGLSMNILGLIPERINPFPVIMHTIGLILILNLISTIRFSGIGKNKYA